MAAHDGSFVACLDAAAYFDQFPITDEIGLYFCFIGISRGRRGADATPLPQPSQPILVMVTGTGPHRCMRWATGCTGRAWPPHVDVFAAADGQRVLLVAER